MSDIPVDLSAPERQNLIYEHLQRQKRLSVTEICAQFAVSQATARRDLETLAGQGRVQRVHGGVILLTQAPPEPPMLVRQGELAEVKQRIGQCAAGLVEDGRVVFLGSGSTVLEVARALRNCRSLTVITNSLPVINTLVDLPGITLVTLGGMLRPSELSFIGHITEQALNEVRADKVILGVHAIDAEQGLTNDYLPETMTDRAILNISRTVVVVADHTKFGRVAAARLAPVERVHTIVTDGAIDSQQAAALQARGVQIVLA